MTEQSIQLRRKDKKLLLELLLLIETGLSIFISKSYFSFVVLLLTDFQVKFCYFFVELLVSMYTLNGKEM